MALALGALVGIQTPCIPQKLKRKQVAGAVFLAMLGQELSPTRGGRSITGVPHAPGDGAGTDGNAPACQFRIISRHSEAGKSVTPGSVLDASQPPVDQDTQQEMPRIQASNEMAATGSGPNERPQKPASAGHIEIGCYRVR